MRSLRPLEVLFDRSRGRRVPLSPALARVYGPLRLPRPSRRPFVLGNFASTLDGVVSLNVPGASGGGDITGFEAHDRLVMGLLRAVADAVIVGAGTLRAVPRHLWTAEHVFPRMCREFAELRLRLGKPAFPLNVVVTARGNLDLTLPVFSSGAVPVLIVTTARGAGRLPSTDLPPTARAVVAGRSDRLTATEVLAAVRAAGRHDVVLVEGGPHLIGDFFGEGYLDDLFLTLAPQIAGREASGKRPGLVAGRIFAPDHPLWGTLVGVRRGGSHLYLRFGFPESPGGVHTRPSKTATPPRTRRTAAGFHP
ncbi:MAG: dihydrofolate reductase family protein [Thermoplasmata archaeon]|nr:dihydrofolate reductase family protein [Thermoplasmata archaeon]